MSPRSTGVRCRVTCSFFYATLALALFCGAPICRAASTDRSRSAPRELSIEVSPGLVMEFVLISPGNFVMGSDPDEGDGDEKPQHRVTISHAYWMGKYEVTQAQWKAIMGTDPSHFKGPNLPVETVSWKECQTFLAKLSQKTGRTFSLPTEAQWEYACRAGTTTPWSFGAQPELAEEFGWVGTNAQEKTHPVGTKKPNPWGLYDMHGNVWEWCADGYINPYPAGEVVDPFGSLDGHPPIVRGGGWSEHPVNLRSAYRNCNGEPDGKTDGIGFRCAMLP